ncbi:hypothetical protein NT6N_33170 [Oceaniferula spumae]|uniref:Uncharacterized protein n=1 Tax=Oceaniferula spumae TaxID=2979115 RepID=A0AAT9FQM1_9BACT
MFKIVTILLMVFVTTYETTQATPEWERELNAYECCFLGEIIRLPGSNKKVIEVRELYWGRININIKQRLNIPNSLPTGSLVFVLLDEDPAPHGKGRYMQRTKSGKPINFQGKILTIESIKKIGIQRRKEGG